MHFQFFTENMSRAGERGIDIAIFHVEFVAEIMPRLGMNRRRVWFERIAAIGGGRQRIEIDINQRKRIFRHMTARGQDNSDGLTNIGRLVRCQYWAVSVLAVSRARDETGEIVPLDVKVGDRIVFGKYAGTEVKLDGEDLVILKEADVFGILEGTERVKAAA